MELRAAHLLELCKTATDISTCRSAYSLIIKTGREHITLYTDHIIRSFASCGSLSDAHFVFSSLSHRSVYTWHALISAYTKHGSGQAAISLYYQMLQDGICPDKHVYTCCIKACRLMDDISKGMAMHALIVKIGLDHALAIGSSLVDMYITYGRLDEAYSVFKLPQNRDNVSWDTIISGSVKLHQGHLAIDLFERMFAQGIKLSNVTYVSVIKGCGIVGDIEYGRSIHEKLLRSGKQIDLRVGNALIDMYSKCGHMDIANEVFTSLAHRDVVSWSVMIDGYTEHEYDDLALSMFERMNYEGIEPDDVTFVCVLKACGSLGAIDSGRLVHNNILQVNIKPNVALENTLVDMYSKCGSVIDARELFDKLPHWTDVSFNSLIAGYAHNEDGVQAVEIYEQMKQMSFEPTIATYVSVIKASKSIGEIGYGKSIHDQVIRENLETDVMVANSIIDLYAKCSHLYEAMAVFQRMKPHSVVSWGIILTGLVENGYDCTAIELYEEMLKDGVYLDKVSLLASLKACGCVGALQRGKCMHIHVVKTGLDQDQAICSSLIEMYCKCVANTEAYHVFVNLSSRDVAMWGAMIDGITVLGNHGLVENILRNMENEGLKPNDQLVTSILSTFSRVGALDSIDQCLPHNATGRIEHYSCVMDILGRTGYLDKAINLVCTMPMSPNVITWSGLLSVCHEFGSKDLGYLCFNNTFKLNQSESAMKTCVN